MVAYTPLRRVDPHQDPVGHPVGHAAQPGEPVPAERSVARESLPEVVRYRVAQLTASRMVDLGLLVGFDDSLRRASSHPLRSPERRGDEPASSFFPTGG